MLKSITRLALSASLLASLSGCYALSLNAQNVSKPVSMTPAIGRKVQTLRHFKKDMLTWYAFGLIPVATMPGVSNMWTPADKLVLAALEEELARGGDGIVNLKVTQEYSILSVLAGIVLGIVPPNGLFSSLLQGWAVSVEGDVVQFAGRAEVPTPGMITAADGEIALGDVDLTGMLRSAMREQKPE